MVCRPKKAIVHNSGAHGVIARNMFVNNKRLADPTYLARLRDCDGTIVGGPDGVAAEASPR